MSLDATLYRIESLGRVLRFSREIEDKRMEDETISKIEELRFSLQIEADGLRIEIDRCKEGIAVCDRAIESIRRKAA